MHSLAKGVLVFLFHVQAFAIDGARITNPRFTAANKTACAKQVASRVLEEIGIRSQNLVFSRKGHTLYSQWFQFSISSPGLIKAEVRIRPTFEPVIATDGNGASVELVGCSRAFYQGTFFELKGIDKPISLCDWHDDESMFPCPSF